MPEGRYRGRSAPVSDEIRLRHLTVDEALLKLDRYLNDAFMAGLYQVRVVHGKGAGILRQAVREELTRHPLVKSHRPGGYGEGGAGVTIVQLAEK
jgi:DNA mismatch repair protein MutS2